MPPLQNHAIIMTSNNENLFYELATTFITVRSKATSLRIVVVDMLSPEIQFLQLETIDLLVLVICIVLRSYFSQNFISYIHIILYY